MSDVDIKKAVKEAEVTNLNDLYPDDVDMSHMWRVETAKALGINVEVAAKDKREARKLAEQHLIDNAEHYEYGPSKG